MRLWGAGPGGGVISGLWGCPSFPLTSCTAHHSSVSKVCGELRRCHPTRREHLGWEGEKGYTPSEKGVWNHGTNQVWG